MQHLLDALLEIFRLTNLILWGGGFQTYKNFSQRFHLLSDDRTLPTQYQMHPQEQLFCRWKLYIHLFRQKWFTLNLQLVHDCSPDSMQSGKANHHAPPPTLSIRALDFQYVPDFPVQKWLFGLTMNYTILLKFNFPKRERNSCFSFSWNYTKSSFKASGILYSLIEKIIQ